MNETVDFESDIHYAVLVGYANGDLHEVQVLPHQQVKQVAADEAEGIGQLTNAGFRTVVAAAWRMTAKRTAGISYAAGWNENEVEVFLHTGDRIASSHSLYRSWIKGEGDPMTSGELLQYCKRLKIE